MTYHYDLFPSRDPQRDFNNARSRSVRARKAIAECERIIKTGCDVSGAARDRLFAANMELSGAQREMAAMRKQGAVDNRMTAAKCAAELRRLRGEAPRKTGPVYLHEPVRKAPLNYITKVIRTNVE